MMDLITLVLACSLYADNSLPYAMIQTGSENDPLVVTVDNHTKHFKTESSAMDYTQKQIMQGKTIYIGLMQLSSDWLSKIKAPPEELFRPCKNVVIATQIMNTLHVQCQTRVKQNPTLNIQTCMLSMYKAGTPQIGLTYAHQVMDYANKHSFYALVKKARDPGMLAAVAKPNVSTATQLSTRLTNTSQKTL